MEDLLSLQQQTSNKLELESIQLLIEELKSENPRNAIIIGLVGNLEKNECFNWITLYLKKRYS